MKKNPKKITGILRFENKKILLETREEIFFVQTKKLAKKFLAGDEVFAKIMKKSEAGRMAEVMVFDLISRSTKTLLGYKK